MSKALEIQYDIENRKLDYDGLLKVGDQLFHKALIEDFCLRHLIHLFVGIGFPTGQELVD